jgi:radical SAM protein with 4Fe4S-binding SPASM domain
VYRGRKLVIGSESISISVPPSLRQEPTTLLATVQAAGAEASTWAFSVGLPANAARIIISPANYDHCFLLLEHPSSPPTAFHYKPGSLGQEGELDLVLQRHAVAGATDARYHLVVSEARIRSWRAQADPRVEWFHVELTSACNLKCSFCPSKDLRRPRSSLSLEDARKIFTKIAEYGNHYDDTIGYASMQRMLYLHILGEPLLHPHFFEIVHLAREFGHAPALFTNASLLDARRIEAIFDADIAHITLSVNAIASDGYKASGAPGTMEDQEQRIVALLRRRASCSGRQPHVDIQFMTAAGRMASGDGLLRRREEFWRLYGHWLAKVREIEAGAVHTVASAAPDWTAVADPLTPREDPSLRFPLASGVELVVKSCCSFGNAILPEGMRVVPTKQGCCPFGSPFRQMAIYSDGSVSFCSLDAENSVQLGNLLEQSVDEIWSGERMRAIRREMSVGRVTEPLCQRCLGTVVRAL